MDHFYGRKQAERTLIDPESSSKKRAREPAALDGFGAETEDEPTESSKMRKLSEDEVPKQHYSTEENDAEDDATKTSNSKRKSVLDDVFDTAEDEDYDASTDRATRLAYLNSLGTKKKPQRSSADDTVFRGSGPEFSADASSSGARGSWKGDSIFKSPSSRGTMSKMEQQEFVKDSVQSKIARESAPALKPANSKSIDFGALMQKISDRQKEIKLPTAEQVGLSALLEQEGLEAYEGEEASLEEEDDDDDVSLEIDDDEGGDEQDKLPQAPNASAPAPFKAPIIPASAPKSKKMILDEDDDESASDAAKNIPVLPSKPRTLFSLDDLELDDEEPSRAVAVAITPSLTQTMDLPPPESISTLDESSQTSVTDVGLQLEYPATLEPEAAKPSTTPAGLVLKSTPAEKPSAMSSWLTGATKPSSKATSAKKTSTATKAKSEATISRSKSKLKDALNAPLFDGELLDENAMTGNDDSNGAQGVKLDKSGSTLKRLQKTRQLFDDEAEAGYGSDGDRLTVQEREANVSGDESEGGASQDAYETEDVHPADAHKVVKRSALDDIFESDDRAVVRSLQVQQDIARERAELQAVEDMAWRRERRTRRHELALHAEANALLDEQRMDERLASRRSQKKSSGSKKSSAAIAAENARAAGDSASLPVSTGAKEWFMDDSDEEDEESRQESEKRRLELLDEQQTRRRLASNSLFLSHDEDSQSILQVIERANTQHSQHSNPASTHDDHNSSSQFGIVAESQDSLGGWFDRPGLASSNFSASNAEHLSKLKSTYKGHATQVLASSLLFQRSQDGFEGSQDGFKDPAPLTRSQSNVVVSSTNRKK